MKRFWIKLAACLPLGDATVLIEHGRAVAKRGRVPATLLAGMIFDLTVPGDMGGRAANEEIRKMDPGIPAFVASGYAEDPIMKNPAAYGFRASIAKPFRKGELVEMLETHLRHAKS